ncbi:AGAP005240-PA-like protein [Anopheles sinensis]|uniref:AGAP005240-PA-like protein n=1 Tax=Anopheles sinensis TaxID=74873 RepID=A0A084WRX3_ANOSI|nr:AGAP005240-PA-like protein [Anopheles sinensis]
MVQYNLIVLFAAFCGAYGAGYEYHDFVSTGICPTRRNVLLETFSRWSQPKEIRILSDPQRGIIYDQSWNSSSFKRYDECKFTLQTPPGAGLYLIVRKLNLRRDSKGNCIDTVTVKQSNNKKTRFCYTPTDVPRSFSDHSHMKITIKLDNFVPLPTVEDTLQVQLIATPKVDCLFGTNRLRCEPYDSESCIDESFSRDGTINCPSCVDEGGCSTDLETVYVADKQSIALTAFVSLLFTMLVCCGCIWCLYKNRRCMTSCSNHEGRAATDNDASNIRFRGPRAARSSGILSVELPGSSHDLRPTAPKLEEKDLPPSYDALFPTAADASTASGPTTVSTATSPTIPSTEVGQELDSTK